MAEWRSRHSYPLVDRQVETGADVKSICQYWNRLSVFVCCKYTITHLRYTITFFKHIFQKSSLLHSQGYKSKRRSCLFYFHVIWSLSLWIKCCMTEYDCKKNYKNTVYKHYWFLQFNTAQSVYQLATGSMVWGSNPGGGEMFHTCPD